MDYEMIYDESYHWCPSCGEPRGACVCDDEDNEPCGNQLAHDAHDETPCPTCGKLP